MRLGQRAAPILAAAVLMSGCGSGGSGDNYWRDYIAVLGQGLGASFAPQRISREQAAAIPYATLGFQVNRESQQLLTLATDTNGDQIWTAASHIVLTTRGGRVLRSVNLRHDRTATATPGTAPLPPPSDALKGAFRSTRLIDFPDLGVYSLEINCVATLRGRQPVKIIGTRINTMRIDERCETRRFSWSFVDSYWLDPESGFVWRSVQHLHPRTILTIEIFRPPE